MSKHTVKQLVIAFIFAIIMIPAFNNINVAILNETLDEAKLSYIERDSYKQLFDCLQEGIIVCQGSHVVFMNDLSNKVMSFLTNHKNFFKRIRNDLSNSDIDRMDVKLFYLFQNNAEKGTKKKKSHASSDASKAAGSASSRDEKTEYSLREILELST